jgi:hypothetical protein
VLKNNSLNTNNQTQNSQQGKDQKSHKIPECHL